MRLVGELDLSNAGELLAALARLPRELTGVLDVASRSFVDVAGLHALEEYAQSLDGASPLVLENVSAHLRRLFALVGAAQNPRIQLRDGSE